jgi:ATP-dependent Lon protease
MQTINLDQLPAEIPLISEVDSFLYPFMISPIFLADEKSIKAIEYAMDQSLPILITPHRSDIEEESELLEKIYDAGVIGSIMRKTSLPDGRVKILFQGIKKATVSRIIDETPFVTATVELIKSQSSTKARTEALYEILKERVSELSKIVQSVPNELLSTISGEDDIDRLIDLISSSLKLSLEKAYKIFIEPNVEERLFSLIELIEEEIEIGKLQKDLKTKVHSKMAKHNRDYFLKEQLKEIQKELGIDRQRDEEIEEYRKKFDAKKQFMGEDAFKEIDKQLNRLQRMHPDSSDANTIQTYIEWVLEIPFGKHSKKKLSISDVEKQLDKDHFSLEKPKERVVEYFSVRELMDLRGIKDQEGRGVILCFVGPPGVGKTSLANSIAKAMKRELVRVALGGLEDVNELRGHRRTYVGAMPGRIVQGIIDAGEMNPVVVLDEIDKVGVSHRGDPTAAMLEILDPEQNKEFRDYYLNFNLDLSKVIFIATANDVSRIPAPLRDRMEFISVSSYTPQEKYQIAKKYLIPQELKKHGLKGSEVSISKKTLEMVIQNYTREAGVRNLRRRIADICRKTAKRLLLEPELSRVSVNIKNIKDFLEKSVFEIDRVPKKPAIGVVYGLAWTSVGGDVLKTEVLKITGKGAFQITGKLGDVMKESARISHSVTKSLFDSGYLTSETEDVYKKFDLHIHIPDGATPKDGPSAGITMTTAIASILSDKPVRGDTAMTGEISLHGDVMPIGGLREKIIAAHRAGIEYVLIPEKNYERDLKDIPDEVTKDLQIIAVSRIEEVLNHMFNIGK